MNKYVSLFLKGMGMGAANVVPGVSGGTIALITGIFEKLIDSIKAVDLQAVKLLFTGKFSGFARKINLDFLVAVFLGVVVSILSIAKLFGFLLIHYPVYIMAFFFGLILASIYFVAKTVTRWNLTVIISFAIGTVVAILLSILEPAQENSSMLYLFVCGIVATCSMILPGLSGSFVLILLGNYQLVMIDAVNQLDLKILLPVVVGAVAGLVFFANLLSWVFKKFRNPTISLLSGFILGSLGIIWPWKNEIPATNSAGELILKDGEPIITAYDWFVPERMNTEVIIAIGLILLGILIIWATELLASRKPQKQ
ncbi:DUF368 domain-containing protein [Roseimarinus sediminis]|jgi:putative membrane protein|uniref:DUF368 domain-containing protein n=1 Tax=Roseimarinus sediminis TaxID=1610899 RepID=UPI003D1FF7AF